MSTLTATLETPSIRIKSTRIESIDLLRGIVMIIMALDHVRDYFHADAFLYNPLDLSKTSVALFFTRWITHFCAPTFVFLAGTSAFLVGTRKGKRELSSFLLKRGLWLLLLEVTVINFAWLFNIEFSLVLLAVIWALGVGMIALAGAIHFPFKMILVLGIILVAGHNLLDPIHVQGDNAAAVGWSLLHDAFRWFQLGHFSLIVGYPVIPWIGIMLLGYCLGSLYQPSVDAAVRKKTLIGLGAGMIALFVVLRFINVYGDPVPWSVQQSSVYTFLSFLNVTKYPPSLLYALVTLGPAILFLASAEKLTGKISQYIIALGRVPMFYYLLHLYWIHLLAVAAALATGYSFSDMTFTTWVTDSPALKGYGFSLGVTYLVYIGVVLTLWPLCLWYDRYKMRHREKWWLSYL
jgi:uncharacterized membrane protein